MESRSYIAIDLKSFYASVECVERGLDPLGVNLVVADATRTEKTICLAVSPSLKAHRIPGRARLFEVIERVRQINAARRRLAPGGRFTGRSCNARELAENSSLELDYIVAKPRMALYMEVSSRIVAAYMRHVSPDDIHAYSIDEVFINATPYLRMYGVTPHGLAMRLIRDVLAETGITATAGIGTNLYLAKVAMDIVAKRMPADRDGVRIAELDEQTYRRRLWTHRPLTDFWRIGYGYAEKLEAHGMRTMGDVARMSLTHEECLYRLFGINAELLIDHAWGWEPCTLADIKAYRPESSSLSVGQILPEPSDFQRGLLVVKEMADSLSLDLVRKHLLTCQMTLTVGYDVGNLKGAGCDYGGPVDSDRYGRLVPREAHGSVNLDEATSSSRVIVDAVSRLYLRIVNRGLLVRRLTVVAARVEGEGCIRQKPEQLDLFTDYDRLERDREKQREASRRERRMQEALIAIRGNLGKNAILKGMNLEKGATARERNRQIGGHNA